MIVTRDVIYDLLPAYFSGDATADSRALVEEFFKTDPEFGRMAARFHTLLNERGKGNSEAGSEAARERATFEQTRTIVKRRNQAFAGGIAYGLATLFVLALANPLQPPMPPRLVVLTFVFLAIQLVSWGLWLRARHQLVSLNRPSRSR